MKCHTRIFLQKNLSQNNGKLHNYYFSNRKKIKFIFS